MRTPGFSEDFVNILIGWHVYKPKAKAQGLTFGRKKKKKAEEKKEESSDDDPPFDPEKQLIVREAMFSKYDRITGQRDYERRVFHEKRSASLVFALDNDPFEVIAHQ